MNTQPRRKDKNEPGHGGRYTQKTGTTPEVDLHGSSGRAATLPNQKLSAPQEKLLNAAINLARHDDHDLLVSGHRVSTAIALERRGLGSYRYQGRGVGWFKVNTDLLPDWESDPDFHAWSREQAANYLVNEHKHEVLATPKETGTYVVSNDNGTLVVTIVKTAASDTYGDPVSRIVPLTVKRADEFAEKWARANGKTSMPRRIDAIAVIAPNKREERTITHLVSL